MNKLLRIGKVFFTLLIFVFSWALIHLMAIFGIFIAVAYLLWWFLASKKTVCFLCRAKADEGWCPFCRRKVVKSLTLSPKNLTSAILNGILVLGFSIVSIAVVFLEAQVLLTLGFPVTPKTVSFVTPAKGQYRLGEIFPMKIEITDIKTPINTIQADLGFDSSKLELVAISTQDSLANIFIQKEIDNDGGFARLTGGLPNPGFLGDNGVFGTAFFRGKSPGLVKIEFLPSSKVLANDGKGTNVLNGFQPASYFILPEKISQEEEERQKRLILDSMAQGENTNHTQMKFYQEDDVLKVKAKVGQEIKEEEKSNHFASFLNKLEIMDSFILEKYKQLFHF